MAKINITSNGFENLTLDTETGKVEGIPENTPFIHVGYLHLLSNHEYTAAEISEINRITTLSFAGKWQARSSSQLLNLQPTQVPVTQEWIDKQIELIKDIAIDANASDMDLALGWAYKSEEDKLAKIESIRDTKTKTQYVDLPCDRELPLGATFQRYQPEGWLDAAKEIKGSEIYLA